MALNYFKTLSCVTLSLPRARVGGFGLNLGGRVERTAALESGLEMEYF